MVSETAGVAGIADRYATALFELAHEEQCLDQVEADLVNLRTLLAASADLQRFVTSPVLSREEQIRGIAAVGGAAGLSSLTQRFLKVVAAKRRLFVVSTVITVLLARIAGSRGEHRVDVVVAQPLSSDQEAALAAALAAVTGGQVLVDITVDPTLLGGLVIRIGSRIIDSSLRTKLQHLQLAMKGIG
ncbi:ATP synthase delta chain [invertebrate metagenome]|uniref:ATP synthase delta chain n=1 Tax=invertebrate metagenome TaxID=1711999 RepID=A0A484H4K4_9ZZZZ